MNNQIKEQLKKCRVASIPKYDDDTLELAIPKQASPKDLGMREGKCYRITVDDYIIHPYSGFTLHDNWNKGVVPTDYEMNIEVISIMGKMLKVEAVGVNDGKSWSGWLPAKAMTLTEEL